jgi:hypothetical protein
MATQNKAYPTKFDIDYQNKHDRLTTFVRIIWSIPAVVLLSLLSGSGSENYMQDAGKSISANGGGIMVGLSTVTGLMILCRQRYPRWWFDFALELNRFSARVGAYFFLLTDLYPSTVEKQAVHLDVEYPNVEQDLNRWLPLVKWLLAIPHYIVLTVLAIGALIATIVAWFSILFTGTYPKSLFDFVVGVGRWNLRVTAYALLLTTDKYPPFSLS